MWLNEDLRIEASSAGLTSESIGIMAWSGGSEHAHIDYVNVSGVETPVPTAYSLAVRAGATQIGITCSWSGSGNLMIANMTSPTTTYYESNMSIYEKTTVSVDETPSVFNVKRGSLSLDTVTTSETWTLYLVLQEVMPYQTSAETY